MKMKRFLLYTLILGFLTALASCGNSYEKKKQLDKKEKAELAREDSLALKVATVPTMDCLPLFIGVEDSMFQKAGVDVHLKMRNAQIDCDTLITGRHVEGFVSDLIRTERLRRQGIGLRYVAATNAYWKLITNRMARVKELKQLSDKMIAMTRFSATDYLADLAIDSAKPKFDVYRVQVNDVHIRLKMLLNNEMDAMLLTEPQATTAVLYKNPVLMDSRDKNVRLGVIAFREASLKDKRRQQQLDTFVKVYNSICDSINDKGLQHYSAVIKKYTGADDKTVKALPKLKYQHAAPPRARDIAVAQRYSK